MGPNEAHIVLVVKERNGSLIVEENYGSLVERMRLLEKRIDILEIKNALLEDVIEKLQKEIDHLDK